jgi:aryl-alcohol dehydrogenase-like predicted oxidoreductase
MQIGLNVFEDDPAVIELCERHGLAGVVRNPLAMGFLSGKFNASSVLPADDVRGSGHAWVTYFQDGRPRQEFLDRLEAIREILASNGRSLVQGALAWLWARSECTIPIPGFKTVAQIEENSAAMQFGPLTPDQMAEIDQLLGREPQPSTV